MPACKACLLLQTNVRTLGTNNELDLAARERPCYPQHRPGAMIVDAMSVNFRS